MKKHTLFCGLLFLVSLLYGQNTIVYSDEMVVTGDNLAFSMNEYRKMIYDFNEGHYWKGVTKPEIRDVIELNINGKNYFLAQLQYDSSYINFTMFSFSRKEMKITYLYSLLSYNPECIELKTHTLLMRNVPGIHISNVPLAIIDYDGNGYYEIMNIVLARDYGDHYYGHLLVLCIDDDDPSYLSGEYLNFIAEKNSTQPPFVFRRDNDRFIVDYTPAPQDYVSDR